MIKLFVGLGNPGPEYQATRHNAGFWWVDALAQELKIGLVVDKGYHGLVGRSSVSGQNLWLLKPQTFMNLSGRSVAALARFYKIAPHEILVAHDELDIVPGLLKLKRGGSHAGHNGLRDIHDQLGSDDYWRLRIGIGHPGVKAEVINWVLKRPTADQQQAIDACIARSLAAVPLLLAGEMQKATMLLHTKAPTEPGLPNPGDDGASGQEDHATAQMPIHQTSRDPAMKISPSLFVALLCAGATFVPKAWSQDVYKCANTYSQTPCPGAVAVDASDSRSPAQKAQTDAATAQAARIAGKMEKDRLALEKRPAVKPTAKALQSDQAGAAAKPDRPTAKTSVKHKSNAPEYFTAAVTSNTKREKKTPGKSGETKPAQSPEKTTRQ